MPFVSANAINQHFEITGDGEQTIVWIHGIGSSLNYWTEDLSKFSDFQHLTYDVRGMGETEGTNDPVSLDIWAKDLSELLKALDIKNAIIAGSSMGGAISQRFAIDYPEQTIALLLLSTSSRVGAAATDHWRAQADETEKKGNKFLAEAQRAVAFYNMDEELKDIAVSTLILVGDADPTTPPGGSVIISRCIVDSELEIYPGLGHAPLHESDEPVKRVQAWLDTVKNA
jgi:pimeloyl-ACP methyl ester carboxylesterase